MVGQNIANVGNPDYARQTGRLTAEHTGGGVSGITVGAGVRVDEVRRHFDSAVEARLRDALSQRNAAELQQRYITEAETIYNELAEGDLATQISELFGAFGALQSQPEDMAARNIVVGAADAMTRNIQRQRSGLVGQITRMNDAAEAATREASTLADELARLNGMIITAEATSNSQASALRDRRDALLRDLSALVDVEARYQENGTVNVYVGSEPLVDFDRSRGLEVSRELIDGVEVARVRFADNRGPAQVRSGEIAGIVDSRDHVLIDQIDQLDELARGLIYEVNRVHSTGKGLDGMTATTGLFDVADRTVALNDPAAELTYPVNNGTFVVHVRDLVTGREQTRQIEVDLDGIGGDTTLESLAAAINDAPNINARVTPDNRLAIGADANTEFWFSEDSSGALAALGVGGFFTGASAATIAIAPEVRAAPHRIAASMSGGAGDGDNAGRLTSLALSGSNQLRGQNISDFHARMVNELAVAGSGARNTFEASDVVHSGLVAQREAISGVSIDEEAIKLTTYERSFQGASRYLNVIDNMTNELMSLVR